MFKIKKKHGNGLDILNTYHIPEIHLEDRKNYKVTYLINEGSIICYCTYITGHVSLYKWMYSNDQVTGFWNLMKNTYNVLYT